MERAVDSCSAKDRNGHQSDAIISHNAINGKNCKRTTLTNCHGSTAARADSPSRQSFTSGRTVSTLSADDASEIFSLSSSVSESQSLTDDTEWLMVEHHAGALSGKENFPNHPIGLNSLEKRATNFESTLRWMNEAYDKPSAAVAGAVSVGGSCDKSELDELNVVSRNVIRSLEINNSLLQAKKAIELASNPPNAVESNTFSGNVGALPGNIAPFGFSQPATPKRRVNNSIVSSSGLQASRLSASCTNVSGLFSIAPSSVTPNCASSASKFIAKPIEKLKPGGLGTTSTRNGLVSAAHQTARAPAPGVAFKNLGRTSSTSKSIEHLAAPRSNLNMQSSHRYSLSPGIASDSKRNLNSASRRLCGSLQSLAPKNSSFLLDVYGDCDVQKSTKSNVPTPLLRQTSQPKAASNYSAAMSARSARTSSNRPSSAVGTPVAASAHLSTSLKAAVKPIMRSNRASQDEELQKARHSVFGTAVELESMADPALLLAPQYCRNASRVNNQFDRRSTSGVQRNSISSIPMRINTTTANNVDRRDSEERFPESSVSMSNSITVPIQPMATVATATHHKCVSRLAAPKLTTRSASLVQPSVCADIGLTLLDRDAQPDANGYF